MRPLLAASLFLLLLIVLIPQAWGQVYGETLPYLRYDTLWGDFNRPIIVTDTLYPDTTYGFRTFRLWGLDTAGIDVLPAPLVFLTLQSWKEYKAECYADSTLERLHNADYDPLEVCLVDYYCLVGSHYRNVWVHRSPTFEGWMDWLERKQK